MSTKAAFRKSGVFCLVLILVVCICRLFTGHYPADSFTSSVDSAIVAVLNPTTSSPSSSTSTLRYDLAVNISLQSALDSISCHDFVATAFYKDSMLGVPDYWIPTGGDSALGDGVVRALHTIR